MEIIGFIVLFFGGAIAVNGIPHFVSGLQGRAFPTPFAKPPGRGESSPVANVLWGALNFVVAYFLLVRVALLDVRYPLPTAVAAFGGLIMAIVLAKHFASVYHTESAPTLGAHKRDRLTSDR
jgi:hypothetical protein